MYDSIPLLYSEGMLFPSIFYAMITDNGSICGSNLIYLFTGIKSIHGFDNRNDHKKRKLTSVSIAKSTNPTYVYYCYDKLTNLYLNN